MKAVSSTLTLPSIVPHVIERHVVLAKFGMDVFMGKYQVLIAINHTLSIGPFNVSEGIVDLLRKDDEIFLRKYCHSMSKSYLSVWCIEDLNVECVKIILFKDEKEAMTKELTFSSDQE